ncbi:methyltransferase domain-containing protein [Streptacidiphilus rugosus]|uniref:methyltransferase domain-containing protein n=1 Tax=Streptacidiphilus rugosus TaxID=405783 RepID=UPI0005647CC2|nr:methyltransferase domain-containing protein [Streptacidiphilus rugosus]
MSSVRWDPGQYLRFANERTRPLHDLLARVPVLPREPASTILDMGCGPGNSTQVLRRRWPEARIIAVDSSTDMLAAARTAGEPTADYVLADARQFDVAAVMPDLIVSNAMLHWVPDHRELLLRWAAALRPGASLAVQVPGNFTAPNHTLLAGLTRTRRWNRVLSGIMDGFSVIEPAEYVETLAGADCTVDAWETTYSILLSGPDAVLEWAMGTGLRPVLTRLDDPEERDRFLAAYSALLRDAYPVGPHGTVFPFRRIFAVATRR